MSTLKFYQFSQKGKKAVGNDEGKEDIFIADGKKIIAQCLPDLTVAIVGYGHCYSSHIDSYHELVDLDFSGVKYNREDFVGDFNRNPRMVEADVILTNLKASHVRN